MEQFSPQQALNALIEIHQQAKSLQDPSLQNILVNLTHWVFGMLNFLNNSMNQLLPQLSALEQKFNVQIEQINNNLSQIQNQKLTLQPKQKSNIIDILEESFGLQNCKSTIIQKAKDNNDNLCIEIVNDGYFYPKMIQYIAEHFNLHFIIYNAKKKKYYKYGQKNEQPLFIYQKNSQIFNVMKKKNQKNKPLTPSLRNSNHPIPVNNAQSSTIFTNQPIQQDRIIQSIEQKIINGLQSSIKKQISAIKLTVPQIQDPIKQVQFKTPCKMTQSQQQPFNQLSEEEEEEDDQIFVCGGKLQQCKNIFKNTQDYAQHMKKFHKNKVPKESSHTLDGQMIE